MHRQLAAVVFDFDYTLADSSRGVAVCIDLAMHVLGLPEPSFEAVCRTIGLSLEETLVALAGEAARPLAPEFSSLFMAKADEVMVPFTTIYPGVRDLLSRLRERRLRLGIVSSKFRFRIEAVLLRDGLLESVDTIVGGEDVAVLKPDPEGLLEVIRRLGVSPTATLYVGDSVVDAQTAQRAGVRFAPVLTGATPGTAFAQYPLCGTLRRATDLIDLVDGLTLAP